MGLIGINFGESVCPSSTLRNVFYPAFPVSCVWNFIGQTWTKKTLTDRACLIRPISEFDIKFKGSTSDGWVDGWMERHGSHTTPILVKCYAHSQVKRELIWSLTNDLWLLWVETRLMSSLEN